MSKILAQGSHPKNGVAVCLCRLWLGRCSFGNYATATGRATGFGISVVVIFSYYLNFISDALV